MSYDLNKVFTEGFTDNSTVPPTVSVARSNIRALHGLFGPKLELGHRSFHPFVTVKGGFVDFLFDNRPATVGTPAPWIICARVTSARSSIQAVDSKAISVRSACAWTRATKSISRAERTTICVPRSAHISGSEPYLMQKFLRLGRVALSLQRLRALSVRTGFFYFFLYFATQLLAPFRV
jgi:hypothetical protein